MIGIETFSQVWYRSAQRWLSSLDTVARHEKS
jgi:hypothetical protein